MNNLDKRQQELFEAPSVSDQVQRLSKMAQMGYGEYWRTSKPVETAASSFKGLQGDYPGSKQTQIDNHAFGQAYIQQYRLPGIPEPEAPKNESTSLLSRVVDLTSLTGRRAMSTGKALAQGAVNADEGFERAIAGGIKAFADSNNDDIRKAVTDAFRASLSGEEKERLTAELSEKYKEELAPKTAVGKIKDFVGLSDDAIDLDIQARWDRYVQAIRRGEAEAPELSTGAQAFDAIAGHELLKKMEAWENSVDLSQHTPEANAQKEQLTGFNSKQEFLSYDLADRMAGWAKDAKDRMEGNPYEFGSPEYFAFTFGGSAPQMLAAAGTGAITRNPYLAAGMIAAPVFGDTYAEGREKGLSADDAFAYATATAISEFLPQATVFKYLDKAGGGFLKKVLKGTIAEGAEEVVTEAMQMGLDLGFIGEDDSGLEWWQRLVTAGVVGGIGGATFGAAYAAADAYSSENVDRVHRDQIDREIQGYTQQARQILDNYQNNPEAPRTIEVPARRPTQTNTSTPPVSLSTPQPAQSSQPAQSAPLKEFTQEDIDYISANISIDDANKISGIQAALARGGAEQYIVDSLTSQLEQLNLRYATIPTRNETLSSTSPDNQIRGALTQDEIDRVRHSLRTRIGKVAERLNITDTLPDGTPLTQEGVMLPDGQVYINPAVIQEYRVGDNLIMDRDQRIEFVAWHELRHAAEQHLSSRPFGAAKLDEVLNTARQNKVVDTLAKAIMSERQAAADSTGFDAIRVNERMATQEALAELSAAIRTGNYKAITARYRDFYPPKNASGIRKLVKDVGDTIRRIVGKITNKKLTEKTLSNEDAIYAMLDVENQFYNTPSTGVPAEVQSPVSRAPQILPRVSGVLYSMHPDTVWWDILNGDQPVPANWSGGDTQSMLQTIWHPYATKRQVEKFIQMHPGREDWFRSLVQIRPGFNKFNQYLVEQGVVTPEEARLDKPLVGSHYITLKNLRNIFTKFGGRAPSISIAVQMNNSDTHLGFGAIRLFLNRDKFDEYGAVAFDYYTPVIESLWAQDPQLAKKIEEGEELSKAEVDRVNTAMVSLGNSPTYGLVRKLNSKLYPDLRKAIYGDDLTGPVYTGVISGLADKFSKLDILYEHPIGSENDGATIPLSKETLESFIEYIDAGKLSPKFSNVLKKVGIPTEMVEGVFREVLNDASSHKPAFGEFKAEEVIDFREDIAAVIAPEDIAQEVKEFFGPIGVPVYSHGKGRSYSDAYNSAMAERGDSILYSSKPISSYSQPGTDQAEKLPSWRTVLSNIQRYRDQIPEVITPEMTREMLRVVYSPNVNQFQVEAFIELTSGNPEFLKYLATEFRTGPNLLNQYLVQSGIVTPEEAQLAGEAEQIAQRPLMAVHNTTIDALRKVSDGLNSGKTWTASVAVLPVFRDYTRYGNISMVIKPETVRNNLSTLHFDDVETTNSSTEAFAKFPEAQEYLTDIQNWVDGQKGISDLESFRNQQYENPIRRLSGIIAHLNGSPFIPNLEVPEMYVDSLRQLRDYLLSGTPMNEFFTDGLQRILPKLLKTSPYGELKAQLTWDDVQEVLVPSSILDQLPENIPVPVTYYDGLITQGEALRRRVLESAALFSVPPGYTRVFDKQVIETGRENYYDELTNPDVYIPDSYIEEIFSDRGITEAEWLLKRRDLPAGLLADIVNKLSTNEFSRSRVAAIIEYLRKTGKFNAAAPLLDDVILGKTVRYVDDISSIKLILERTPGHITEILKSANLINSEKLQLKEYFRFADAAALPSIIEDSNSFLAVELLPYLPEGASGSILNAPTLDGMLTTDTLPLNTFLKFKVEDIRETESQRTVLNTPEYRAAALEKYLKDPTEVARGYIQETISKLPQDQVVNLINDYSSTKAVISVANIIAKENSWEDGGLQVYDAVLDIYRRWASGVPNPPQVRVNVSDNLTLMKSLIERDGYENFNEHELSELIKSPRSSSDFKSETFKELVKRKVNVRTISNLFTYGHAEWNDVTKAAYNGVQRYRREMRPVMDIIENQENPTLQSVAKDLGWQKDRLEALLSKGVGKDQVASWRKNNGKIDRLQLLEAFGNAEYTVLGTFTRSGMQAIGGEDHAIIFDNPAVNWFDHSGVRSTITGSSHPPGFAFTLYHDFTDTDGKQAAVITEVQSDVMSLLYDERKFNRISDVDDEEAEALRVQAEPFKKTWPRAVMRNAMRHLFNSGYERIYALTHNGVKQLGANPPLSVINDTVGAKAAAEEGFGPAAQKQLGPNGEAYEVWSPVEKDSVAAQNILFSTAPKWETGDLSEVQQKLAIELESFKEKFKQYTDLEFDVLNYVVQDTGLSDKARIKSFIYELVYQRLYGGIHRTNKDGGEMKDFINESINRLGMRDTNYDGIYRLDATDDVVYNAHFSARKRMSAASKTTPTKNKGKGRFSRVENLVIKHSMTDTTLERVRGLGHLRSVSFKVSPVNNYRDDNFGNISFYIDPKSPVLSDTKNINFHIFDAETDGDLVRNKEPFLLEGNYERFVDLYDAFSGFSMVEPDVGGVSGYVNFEDFYDHGAVDFRDVEGISDEYLNENEEEIVNSVIDALNSDGHRTKNIIDTLLKEHPKLFKKKSSAEEFAKSVLAYLGNNVEYPGYGEIRAAKDIPVSDFAFININTEVSDENMEFLKSFNIPIYNEGLTEKEAVEKYKAETGNNILYSVSPKRKNERPARALKMDYASIKAVVETKNESEIRKLFPYFENFDDYHHLIWLLDDNVSDSLYIEALHHLIPDTSLSSALRGNIAKKLTKENFPPSLIDRFHIANLSSDEVEGSILKTPEYKQAVLNKFLESPGYSDIAGSFVIEILSERSMDELTRLAKKYEGDPKRMPSIRYAVEKVKGEKWPLNTDEKKELPFKVVEHKDWVEKVNGIKHNLSYYWDPNTPDSDIKEFINVHSSNPEFLRKLAIEVKPGFNKLNKYLVANGIVAAEEVGMHLPLVGTHSLSEYSLAHIDKKYDGNIPSVSIALRRTDTKFEGDGFGDIILITRGDQIGEVTVPFDFWSPSFSSIGEDPQSEALKNSKDYNKIHEILLETLKDPVYAEIYEMGKLLYPNDREALYGNRGKRGSALTELIYAVRNGLDISVSIGEEQVGGIWNSDKGVFTIPLSVVVRAFNKYLKTGDINTSDFNDLYNRNLLKEIFDKAKANISKIRPSYFESKSLDVINLKDIPAALVPAKLVNKMRPILDKYGIEIFEYSKGPSDQRKTGAPLIKEQQDKIINKYGDAILYSAAPSWNLQDVPTTRPGLARRLMDYVRSPEFADKWADRQGELERIMRADPRATPVRHAFKGYNARVQHQLEKEVEPRFHKLSDALVQYYNQVKDLPVYKALGSSQSQKVFLEHLDKIGKYVYHGRERNIEIAVRTGGEDFAGSGRNEAEIIEVENFFNTPERGSGQMLRIYEEIYRDHLKPLMDYSDQILRDTGLLTPEMEAARPKYQWYVPLYGKPELEDPSTNQNILDSYVSRGGGTQRDVLQNKHHTAGGRHGTEAHSLFETVFTQAEIAVRRAQMQEAKAALWDYLQSPRGQQLFDAKIHTVFGGPTQNASVDQQGQVTWANALSPGANDVVYQNGSELHVMAIGNPRALSAIKDFNKAVITNNIEKGTNWLTRFMGSMYTRFNPSFIVKNKFMDSLQQWQLLLADAPTGTQLSTSGLFGHLPAAANVASRIPLVMKAMSYNAVWTGMAGQTPDYRKWLDRYAELGGVTTYAKFLGHDQLRNLQQEFYEKSQGVVRFANPKNQLTALGKLADGINNVLELTTRVSAFRALVESGVDEVTAANYVKDIMNFETKGEFAIHANSIWPFFTSSMYDIRRIGKALTKKEGQVVFLALVGASYALWEMLAQVGGEDEDGIPWVDKYPMGIAARHFIVPIASDDGQQRGEGVRLPIGYGLGRLANSLALSMRRLANGTDDSGNFVSNVVNHSLIGSFSPLQPSDVSISNDPGMWMLNTFAPQVMKPIIQFGANKNWRGTPIYDSGVFRADGDLDYNSGFAWTPDTYKMISEKIYDATGGDIAPESLQFWVQTAIGGLGTDIVSMAEMVVDQQGLGNTTTASWYKAFPVLGGFIQTSPSEDRERYYTYRDRVSDQYNRLIDAAKRGKDITDYQTALQWDRQFEVVDKQLSKLRKQKKAARESLKGEELRVTERRINAVEKMIQTNIIRQYEEQTGERK